MCVVIDIKEGCDGNEMEGHVFDSLGKVFCKECVLDCWLRDIKVRVFCRSYEYGFLNDLTLVVFVETHEIGL